MKLVTFMYPSRTDDSTPHAGIIDGDTVIDLARANKTLSLTVPTNIQDIIEQYASVQQQLRSILVAAQEQQLSAAITALTDVTLLAPIPRPRKNIMCIGVNYSEHVRETATHREHGGKLPTAPVIFTKAPTTVNSPYGTIEIDPNISTAIDWEVELGVIIGKRGKNIAAAQAMDYVFGYTVINDVTARDLQTRHKQFFKGKSLDGSCPMGPWIVTADDIVDPQNLVLRLRVNGVTKQEGNTGQMIFAIPELIATLSLGMTLEPGDIIATGTPSGVGFSRPTPEFLQPGDIMESEIEGIGTLRNLIK